MLPDPDEKVIGPLTGTDVFHIGLHLAIVVLCLPPSVALDPITAGAVSVLAVEATQWRERNRITSGDARDLIFRTLGAGLGILIGLPFGLIPTL